ncbi:MAG TPA: tetratricopeptide repeat protein [Polyangia bacterium]
MLLVGMSAPARADNDSDRALAREHYLKGSRAFDLGAFDEAIREYSAAYRIKDDPALLYNLGQANRLAGHVAEALRSYKVYLSREPEAANRAEVEAKIAELQNLIDQQSKSKGMRPDQPTSKLPPAPAATASKREERIEPAPAAQPRTTAPANGTLARTETHVGRTKKITGLAVAAVGVAAIATGITFGVLAKNAGDDLSSLDMTMGRFDASTQQMGKTDQIVAAVMLGVGGAALVAGVSV